MIAIPSTAAPLGADWLARAGWGASALLHVGLAAAIIGWGEPDATPPQPVVVSVVMVSADSLDGGGHKDDAAASGASMPIAASAATAGPAHPVQQPVAQPAPAAAAVVPETARPSSAPPAPAAPAHLPDSGAAAPPPPAIDPAALPRPAVKPAPPARAAVAVAPSTPSPNEPPEIEPAEIEPAEIEPAEIKPAAGSPDVAPGAAAESAPQTAAVPALPTAPTAGSGAGLPGAGRGMMPAAALANPEPGYPAVSRQRGEEGRVVLLAELSAAGTVVSLTVKQSSGHPRLDRAALEAVRRWRFAPARIGEQAVASTLDVPIVFALTR